MNLSLKLFHDCCAPFVFIIPAAKVIPLLVLCIALWDRIVHRIKQNRAVPKISAKLHRAHCKVKFVFSLCYCRICCWDLVLYKKKSLKLNKPSYIGQFVPDTSSPPPSPLLHSSNPETTAAPLLSHLTSTVINPVSARVCWHMLMTLRHSQAHRRSQN